MSLLSLFKKPKQITGVNKIYITSLNQEINYDWIVDIRLEIFEYKPEAVVFCIKSDERMEYHFVLTTGYGVHICNEFLRSLNTGIDIAFESYKQYSLMLENIRDHLYSSY